MGYAANYRDITLCCPNLTLLSGIGSNIQFVNSLKVSTIFATSLASMDALFQSNVVLQSAAVDMAGVTSAVAMFAGCNTLDDVTVANTSSVTAFDGMFGGCTVLETVPLFDTSSGATMAGMFANCASLTTIPLLDMSSVTDASYMFSGCTALTSIPLLDASSITDATSMFDNCTSLTAGAMSGTKVNISYANCPLDAAALEDIFDGLATVTEGQTITIAGCPGAPLLTVEQRAIATDKGWTIVEVL